MKKLFFGLLGLAFFAVSCVKDEPILDIDEPVVVAPTDSILAKGTFSNGVHVVSGSVSLIKKADGKHVLAFENFASDAGPDIRIYLSKDKNASDFVEVSPDVNAGNYALELPATAKIDSQKFVLVWCKQFSVLFGSAELK